MITLFQSLGWQELLIRLGAAAICGFVIGIDREMKNKPLGMRTFMLVTVASAGFVVTMLEIGHYYVQILDEAERGYLRIHSTEMVNGLITGIGFLGAGSILRNGNEVVGATTGAGIWMAGAIGAACGLGFMGIALILTLFAFTIITLLGWVEHRMINPNNESKG